MNESNGDCFIIMPITAREEQLKLYGGDIDHFKHALNCIFIPAIQKAGFNPIPPASVGGELIHSDIVDQLSKARMVLCDMSGLNANVFFEFGIRTALNLPVALIVDDVTPAVPFDAAIINFQRYSSQLLAWEIDREVSNLTKHITAVSQKADGKNALWKFFGVASAASPSTHPASSDKLDVIFQLLNKISTDSAERRIQPTSTELHERLLTAKFQPGAVVTEQEIGEATDHFQRGILRIKIVRDVFNATGSGKFTPKMLGIPFIEAFLVETPSTIDSNEITMRPGTGTNYDFNISLKSRRWREYLPLGTYVFEYTAESPGPNKREQDVYET